MSLGNVEARLPAMEISKIFVVYDPTRAEQPALVRAAGIAAEIGCKVHVFAAIYADIGKGDSRPARATNCKKERLPPARHKRT